MNTATQFDTTFATTVGRHLNTDVITAASLPNTASQTQSVSVQDTAQDGIAAQNVDAANCARTTTVLYNLLMQYVDLLEDADHGGWTLQEDNAVRDAINVLARQGWKVRLPHRMA